VESLLFDRLRCINGYSWNKTKTETAGTGTGVQDGPALTALEFFM